ncbi:homoprotocatechuate degradation operon regulator HpaR [Variovorax sp. J31P207]|uniref:homoprotocatechuate degradation operon regulator HpaR n=1 Tax=Variovorax sp. J31P207 TaxID=3053510 RepID=UPI002577DA3F|nr:homoprotocatechuate degradation operon regulator HpaR [Variovorax sp. J31P207]MDM0071522.1 homoprotocatechuate degradation operon regulator HpaR [Variovorax sp. J31P207]
MSRASAGFRHRNLPLLLLDARETVLARFRPLLNASGVTEQQWRILRALMERGAMEPRQIVDDCRISSSSLAGVLARMDDLGMVHRERHAGDQRRVAVTLTSKSRALALKLAPQIEPIYADLEAHVGREFVERLYATLDELIELVGQLPPLDE